MHSGTKCRSVFSAANASKAAKGPPFPETLSAKKSSGLQSRFNKYFYFDDYNGSQLMAIFDNMCKKNGYSLDDEARETAEQFFTQLYETRDENFGNARDARNIFEDMVVRQADRLSAAEGELDKDALMRITKEDFLPEAQAE